MAKAKRFEKFNCRLTTTNENEYNEYRNRVDALKQLANSLSTSTVNTDADFVDFLMNHFEENAKTNKLTPKQRNLSAVHELIQRQIDINETDDETFWLGEGENAKEIFINKRYITPAWVQKELGCSFGPIKDFFGIKDEPNEENRKMLDKHHKKCNIGEHHNRLIAKALKLKEKNSNAA